MGLFDGKNALGIALNPLAALGTGLSLGQGYMDYRAAEKDREAAAAANAANIAFQKEFAQHGIRWRAEDAEAAGIHKLAALGAPGASFSPSVIPESSGDKYRALGRMGQDVSRAFNVTLDPYEKASRALQLESMQIDNAIKKKQLEGLDSPGVPGPRSNSGLPLHLLGQNPLSVYNYGNGYVTERPVERSHSATGKPFQAAGHYSDYVFARTPTGLHPVPSKEMQEAIEDKFIPESLWAMRNYIYPTFSSKTRALMAPSKKDYPLPEGYEWYWKPSAAEFRPMRKKKTHFGIRWGD